MASIKCKECGNEIEVKMKTCPECGTKFKGKSLLKKWWVWLIFFIVIVIIIVGITILSIKQWEDSDSSEEWKKIEKNEDGLENNYEYYSEIINDGVPIIKIVVKDSDYFTKQEMKEIYEKYAKENCKVWFFKTKEDAENLESYNIAEIKKESGIYKIHRFGEETEEERAERIRIENEKKMEEQKRKEEEEKERKEQKEHDFKASCSTYTFKEIARNPENFKGTNVKLTGEVIQTIYGTYSTVLRVNITKEGNYTTYYSDTVYVTYYPEQGEDKILEDDIITIWGTSKGDTSYTTTMGGTITLPHIEAKYITINE